MADTEKLTILTAALDDVPAIVEIYNQSVMVNTASADCEPTTLEARLAWFTLLTELELPILVAKHGQEVVAWGALNPYSSKSGYRFTADDSIYVDLAWTGKGLGKKLLSALIEAGKARGLHSIVASIATENVVSVRLHEQLGFVICARYSELFFKFDRWLDVVHMQLMLDRLDAAKIAFDHT